MWKKKHDKQLNRHVFPHYHCYTHINLGVKVTWSGDLEVCTRRKRRSSPWGTADLCQYHCFTYTYIYTFDMCFMLLLNHNSWALLRVVFGNGTDDVMVANEDEDNLPVWSLLWFLVPFAILMMMSRVCKDVCMPVQKCAYIYLYMYIYITFIPNAVFPSINVITDL